MSAFLLVVVKRWGIFDDHASDHWVTVEPPLERRLAVKIQRLAPPAKPFA